MMVNKYKAMRERDSIRGEFRSKVGVTQSGDSRYEGGRQRPPKPVQMLIALTYGAMKEQKAVLRRRGIGLSV